MLSSAPLAQPGKEAPLASRPSGERSFKDSMEAEEEASLARLVSPPCPQHLLCLQPRPVCPGACDKVPFSMCLCWSSHSFPSTWFSHTLLL